MTGLPVAWETRASKEADMRVLPSLLAKLGEAGAGPATVAMDAGYDCQDAGALPVVAARRNSGTGEGLLPRRLRDLYRGRAAVEREFGRLKHELALTPLRVRGRDRVGLHADLVILTRLAAAVV